MRQRIGNTPLHQRLQNGSNTRAATTIYMHRKRQGAWSHNRERLPTSQSRIRRRMLHRRDLVLRGYNKIHREASTKPKSTTMAWGRRSTTERLAWLKQDEWMTERFVHGEGSPVITEEKSGTAKTTTTLLFVQPGYWSQEQSKQQLQRKNTGSTGDEAHVWAPRQIQWRKHDIHPQ